MHNPLTSDRLELIHRLRALLTAMGSHNVPLASSEKWDRYTKADLNSEINRGTALLAGASRAHLEHPVYC